MHKTKVVVQSYDAYGISRSEQREVTASPHAVTSLFNEVPMVHEVRVSYDDGSFVIYKKKEDT